ncbi:hypothetical protein HUN08_05855 [Gordonia sp. X0973]|uniref:hypothetical protein n=1 Tax=Gordonia sp. X0973 TaxID=2742602 RepID=UPI000F535471|nr:hypothetical protein [Gordonia sp. X0973]QKT06772.1 hypothetical protein HUN08_05855 [Gordonia sp. X0973]
MPVLQPTATARPRTFVGSVALGASLCAIAAAVATSPTASASILTVDIENPPAGGYLTECAYKVTVQATMNAHVNLDDYSPDGTHKHVGEEVAPVNQTIVFNWTPKVDGARKLVASQAGTNSKLSLSVTVNRGVNTGSLCLPAA